MWNCFLFSLVEKSVFSCEGMWSARGPYSGADLVACESVVAATECSEGFTFFSTFSFLPFHLVSTAWYLKAGLVSQPNSLWFLERPQRASGSGWREKQRKTAASQPTAALVSRGSTNGLDKKLAHLPQACIYGLCPLPSLSLLYCPFLMVALMSFAAIPKKTWPYCVLKFFL